MTGEMGLPWDRLYCSSSRLGERRDLTGVALIGEALTGEALTGEALTGETILEATLII